MASAAIAHLDIIAPPVPDSWTPKEDAGAKISELRQRRLLPVGPAYLAHARRVLGNKTFAQDDADEELNAANGDPNGAEGLIEDDLGVGDEPESSDLLLLDPKDWKNQDHYKVLGLSKLRINATLDQIRVAHRKKVLKHHPDKKAGSGDTNDDALFKCIQKAFEILSNAEKRRQFDSVDPYFLNLEADPPTSSQISTSPKAFFSLMAPVFEMEARFSKTQPAVPLGSEDASKEEVEAFYDFWYNFDSWRSFEYRDKEVNEGSDSRDDKRYTLKKNKNERDRLKKEDTARVRGLVDLAMACDPRIKRIKQEEKAAREAKKKSGPAGKGKPSKAEEAARLAAEEKAKQEAEEAAKAEAKKAKAAAANAAKKARRAAKAEAEASGSATPA
ncbi:hypothetical protein M408DRAFT_325816 [Serendipita vermifera MAFF 305830]|uniref:J domain-containing protein n=1 Tax=Serendipita vermifera MAFF 305830 TaxID=933852 RepID=A0A0C3BQN1_SERVB|nr:hypothetical protein M408DRAFT_325816 [Serendipita vermifera MAFF 305830]